MADKPLILLGNAAYKSGAYATDTLADMIRLAQGPDQLSVQGAYEAVGWMARCIHLRAHALADIPQRITTTSGAEIWSSDDPVVPGELAWMGSLYRLLYLTEASLTLEGRAYAIREMERGRPTRLQWCRPGTLEERYNAAGEIVAYDRSVQGQMTRYDPEDVLAVYLPSPYVEVGPGAKGEGHQARVHADVLRSLDTFLDGHLDRGLVKATLLAVPRGTPKNQRDALEVWWKRWFRGKGRAGEQKVIEADTVQPITIGEGLKDLENVDIVEQQQKAMATSLGVPHSLVLSNAANYATAEVEDERFYTQTVIPRANMIAREVNRQLFGPMGLALELDTDRIPAMQRSFLRQAQALYRISGGAVLTRDEARERLGLETTDDASSVEASNLEVTPDGVRSVGDDALRELRRWRRKVKRHGRSAPFSCDHLPGHVEQIVRERLAVGATVDHAFAPPYEDY